MEECAQEFRDTPRAFGQQPIEAHFKAGEQVRRAFFTGSYGRRIVAITFSRAPGSDPRVIISTPVAPGEEKGDRAEANLSASDWKALIDRSSFFHHAVPPRPVVRTVADGGVIICGHASVIHAEASDPRPLDDWGTAGVRGRAETTCDKGLTGDFANWAADFAGSKLPYCSGLADADGFSPRLLATCARFSGDRVAAAELRSDLADRGGALDEVVAARFAYEASLEWGGELVTDNAAQTWRSRTSGELRTSYYQSAAHGETSERVRTKGHLDQWREPKQNSKLWRAPVEITWERRFGRFEIVRAVVGKFERVRRSCPSGLLTGAEQANNCVR